ncbi:hypothetical protein C8Q80DRAFT_154440 [Daedaleopsis nitida]|nr:hypothetical protein C8Q80DRAFT_154440 [Daedaleopsis nitida]
MLSGRPFWTRGVCQEAAGVIAHQWTSRALAGSPPSNGAPHRPDRLGDGWCMTCRCGARAPSSRRREKDGGFPVASPMRVDSRTGALGIRITRTVRGNVKRGTFRHSWTLRRRAPRSRRDAWWARRRGGFASPGWKAMHGGPLGDTAQQDVCVRPCSPGLVCGQRTKNPSAPADLLAASTSAAHIRRMRRRSDDTQHRDSSSYCFALRRLSRSACFVLGRWNRGTAHADWAIANVQEHGRAVV